MILSLLICTLPARRDMLDRLLSEIKSQQLQCGVEIEVLCDAGEGTVGAKRQRLLEKAQGDYVAFIDDDDEIQPAYLSAILGALSTSPDVVGFTGIMTTNGTRPERFRLSKDFNYEKKKGIYYRYSNHLCPVRRELALQVGFKTEMTFFEDFDYATRLRPFLHTEVFIEKNLYHYKYLSKK